MFTIMLGLRLSLRPCWPWRPIEQGWLSLLFIHFLISMSLVRSLKKTPVEIKSTHSKPIIVDETKRKSVQPGTMADVRVYKSMADLPRSVVIKVKAKSEETMVVDHTKSKSVQPRGDDPSIMESDKNRGKTFTHKFYGSQLIVGSRPFLSGLSVGMHTLEITAQNQVFIDNNPYPINPTDLVNMKEELSKVR